MKPVGIWSHLLSVSIWKFGNDFWTVGITLPNRLVQTHHSAKYVTWPNTSLGQMHLAEPPTWTKTRHSISASSNFIFSETKKYEMTESLEKTSNKRIWKSAETKLAWFQWTTCRFNQWLWIFRMNLYYKYQKYTSHVNNIQESFFIKFRDWFG